MRTGNFRHNHPMQDAYVMAIEEGIYEDGIEWDLIREGKTISDNNPAFSIRCL